VLRRAMLASVAIRSKGPVSRSDAFFPIEKSQAESEALAHGRAMLAMASMRQKGPAPASPVFFLRAGVHPGPAPA